MKRLKGERFFPLTLNSTIRCRGREVLTRRSQHDSCLCWFFSTKRLPSSFTPQTIIILRSQGVKGGNVSQAKQLLSSFTPQTTIIILRSLGVKGGRRSEKWKVLRKWKVFRALKARLGAKASKNSEKWKIKVSSPSNSHPFNLRNLWF